MATAEDSRRRVEATAEHLTADPNRLTAEIDLLQTRLILRSLAQAVAASGMRLDPTSLHDVADALDYEADDLYQAKHHP